MSEIRECRTAVQSSSMHCLNRYLIPMKPLNCSKSIPKPCSAWRGEEKFPVFKSAGFGAFEDRNQTHG